MNEAGRSGTTRRGRGPERAANLLSARIRSASEKRGFAVTRLLTHWAEIAGDEIAAAARPVEISYGRGFGATLTLLCPGARAPIVEMQKETLRERVNACYGYNAIACIRITQTSATGFADAPAAFEHAPRTTPPEVAEKAGRAVGGVSDTGLRDALETLGRHVLARPKT